MRYGKVAGHIRHLSGWKKDRPDHRDKLLAVAPVTLPDRADMRGLCPPIFDQKAIGSCTANAGCEAMEFLQRKAQGDTLYSRLFLYYYTRELEGTDPRDDSGAMIRTVMKALGKYGVCLESTWPYDTDKYPESPPGEAVKEAEKYQALFYFRCPTLFTIKASIAQGFPVEFGFSVPQNMMSDHAAATGEVTYPTRGEGIDGGHAVLAVGFDDAKTVGGSVGAIVFQNSWGTGWGDNGFGYLPYSFFTEGLADDAWTIRRTG